MRKLRLQAQSACIPCSTKLSLQSALLFSQLIPTTPFSAVLPSAHTCLLLRPAGVYADLGLPFFFSEYFAFFQFTLSVGQSQGKPGVGPEPSHSSSSPHLAAPYPRAR